MTRRNRATWIGLLLAGALVAAACGVDSDVAAERSDRIGRARPSREVSTDASIDAGTDSDARPDTGVESGTDAGADETAVLVSTLSWSGCDSFGIPPADLLGTQGWECTTLSVPMDPFGDSTDLDDVELALTRHRATGERQGALLMNPGGPGGSGLEVIWNIRGDFPVSVLRSYDIVSWDPRGVGSSVPPIGCGPTPDLDSDFLMLDCAEATGDLVSYLSASYSAADMDAIRLALGEPRLDYLGYSYGSTLGARYAELYPDTVGRFVLDGVTDPLIGSADGYFEFGFPYYAEDGTDAATTRFEELCDASDLCDLGSDSRLMIVDLTNLVADLPTEDFTFEPQIVTQEVFDEVFFSALAWVGNWELMATALSDARRGDASALAALASIDPNIGSTGSDDPPDVFELANLVIYCADFAHVILEWSYCDGIPRSEFPLLPVVPVDVAEPILVIGTTFDPATPGKLAPDFAAALDDAVHMTWDGVGHTAFPAPTACINDAVADFLVSGALPSDATTCAFLEDVTGDENIADELFGHDGIESENLLRRAFAFPASDAEFGECVIARINQLDDQIISHVVLGVTSDQADAAIDAAFDAC